jgi:hypothetical protein
MATDEEGVRNFLFQSPGDARFVQIVRGHLHFNMVADRKAHPTLAHFAADCGQDEVFVRQFDPEHGPGQYGRNATFDFNVFFFHGLDGKLCLGCMATSGRRTNPLSPNKKAGPGFKPNPALKSQMA